MISNTKLGLGLAALLAVMAGSIFVFSRPSSSSDPLETSAPKAPSAHSVQKANPQNPYNAANPSTPAATKSEPASNPYADLALSPPNAVPGVAAPDSSASSPAQLKAMREEQKRRRAQAVDEMRALLAKSDKVDPKELRAVIEKIEKTIDSPEGKKQLYMALKVHENSTRIQTLAVEMGRLAKSNNPQTKARERQIISEIESLQLDNKNAVDSTQQFAKRQLGAAK